MKKKQSPRASSGFSRTERFALRGLDVAPAQTRGSVRLVPLLRREVRPDLRLARRRYDERVGVVALEGEATKPGLAYTSFIPHGLVVSWGDDGAPAASYGAVLARDGKKFGRHVRLLHRMAKREDDRALRILPLHLAMEGFLSLCFGGPDIAWTEYSRRAISHGLDPRCERSIRGGALPGLDDALRVFEIHERQTGVLVFVADALAAAFVVPHPDDYRALHRTLIEDFYGELIFRYGLLYPDVPPAQASIDARRVESLDNLAAAVTQVRRSSAEFAEILAAGVLDRSMRVEDVYKLGPFRLERFMTSLRLHEENHIGERIVRDDGTIEYLKTYRLSDAQARRAYLLEQLQSHGWNLEQTAAALGTSLRDLVLRIEGAGFGYLIKPHVRAAAHARRV